MLMGSLQVFLVCISLQILVEPQKTMTSRWVLSAPLRNFENFWFLLHFYCETTQLARNIYIMAIRSSCDTFPLGKCWEISLQNAEVNSKPSIILSWFLSQIAPPCQRTKMAKFFFVTSDSNKLGVSSKKTCASRHINSLYSSGQMIFLDLIRGSPFWWWLSKGFPPKCPEFRLGYLLHSNLQGRCQVPPIHKRKALSSRFRTTVICPEKTQQTEALRSWRCWWSRWKPFRAWQIQGDWERKKVGRRNLI